MIEILLITACILVAYINIGILFAISLFILTKKSKFFVNEYSDLCISNSEDFNITFAAWPIIMLVIIARTFGYLCENRLNYIFNTLNKIIK